ncbi:MAG: hypothetical protein IEMM0008_0553 [bacterium]|nr:MAG: hypothetical protein IEMM0008_0553 [bacterium]
MLKNKDILKVLLSILLLSLIRCGDSELLEQENNDQLDTANPIALNSLMIGRFNHSKDKDYYVLDLSKSTETPKVLSIQLSRIKGFDVQIKIYEEHRLIKVIDDFNKNDGEHIDNLIVRSKKYYILVSPGKWNQQFLSDRVQFNDNPVLRRYQTKPLYPTDPYRLAIHGEPLRYQELEPNDSLRFATPMAMNQPIEGYFSPFRNANTEKRLAKNPFGKSKRIKDLNHFDLDWYSLEIPESGSHNISVILDSASEVDTILGVYQGQPIKLVNSRGDGKGERIDNISVKGKKRFYVLVIGVPNSRIISQKSYLYKLSVKTEADQGLTVETENNNSFDEADEITDEVIQGKLSSKDDIDFYRLKLESQSLEEIDIIDPRVSEEGYEQGVLGHKDDWRDQESSDKRTLETSVSAIPGVDLELRLYDSKRKLIKIYNNNPVGMGETIYSYDLSSHEMVYIVVRTAKDQKGENPKKSYQLVTRTHQPKKDYELEPNNVKIGEKKGSKDFLNVNQRAFEGLNYPNQIRLGQKIKGFMNPIRYRHKDIYQKGDVDVYEISLEQGKTYKLILKGVQGVQLQAMIYHTDGIPLRQFKQVNLKGGRRVSKTFEVPIDDRDFGSFLSYYIKIQSRFGKTGSSKAPYTLQIMK